MRRLRRTLDVMIRLSFGSEPEARAALARINAIHDRVSGELPEEAGAFAAGTRYSAHDPALLAWVHATLLDMNLRVYELYVQRLTVEEKDHYCAEASAIEESLGIPEGRLPRNFRELGQYLERMYASGQIVVTDTARTLARAVIYPPVPFIARPVTSLSRLTAFGLLPPTIRQAYGFSWTSRNERALRLSAGLIRRILPLLPPIVRHWRAARRVGSRAGLVGLTGPRRSPPQHGDFDSQTGQLRSTGG
jgi:uncharacterized protein (DUF2236 family)